MAGRRLRSVVPAALLALLAVVPARAADAPTPPPKVVVGSGGWLYISQDWRVACQDAGNDRRVAEAASALVSALERGGRRAVVVVGPDKSTVVRSPLPATGVPDRACGDAARARAWSALSRSRGFLDLRPALASASRGTLPTYWRKDTHWTPTGGAVFARALAERLDPALGRRVALRPGTYSRDGDLARDLGLPSGETVRGAQLVNPYVTGVDEGYWLVGMPQAALVSRTVVQPGGRVVPGRTVVLGDSFTGTAYASLRPLFEEGVYFHPGYGRDDLGPVLAQLVNADTVVVEVVERFDQRYRMFEADAVEAVRALPPRSAVVTVPGQPVGVPCPCPPPSLFELATDRPAD